MWSGAQWRSNPPLTGKRQQDWDRTTLLYWRNVVDKVPPNKSGLEMLPARFFWDAPGSRDACSVQAEHWWIQEGLVPVKEFSEEECSKMGFAKGFAYETIAVNPRRYCEYLLGECKAKGMHWRTMRVDALAEVFEAVPDAMAVVNCTGLEAGKLVGDKTVYPTKGQTLLVKGRAKYVSTRRNENGKEPWEALVLPRPGEEVTLLGGCKWQGDWNTKPNDKMTELILERCKPLAPELLNGNGEFDLLAVQVGLRPSRLGGPRVEANVSDCGRLIVHNYGHHSAGFEGSVGAAEASASLLEDCLVQCVNR